LVSIHQSVFVSYNIVAGVMDTVPFPHYLQTDYQITPDFSNLDEAELKSLSSIPISVTYEDIKAC
jgi:hypothetical protein